MHVLLTLVFLVKLRVILEKFVMVDIGMDSIVCQKAHILLLIH